MTSDLEGRVKDAVQETKQHVIEGIMDSGKPGLRTLPELAKPLPPATPAGTFAEAIQQLNREGVLPLKPTPAGPAYGYDHQKARERGYV